MPSSQAKAGFQTAAGFLSDVHQIVEDGKQSLSLSRITDSSPTPIQCDLAVSAGDLNKETFEKMEDDYQIMLAGAVQSLAKLEVLSFDAAMSCLMNNPLLEPTEGGSVSRSDKIIKMDKNWFKWNGNLKDSVNVKEVKSWFARLVQDKEIMDDITLDLIFFGRVVTYAAKTVNLFEASLSTEECREHDIIKMAVLRYPDHEHPCMMLYEITMTAWRDGSRNVFSQEDVCGLTGEFHSVKFKPRTTVLRLMSDVIKKKAIAHSRAMVRNPPSVTEFDPEDRAMTFFQTAGGLVHDIHEVVEEGKRAFIREPTLDGPRPFQCNLAVSAGDLNMKTFENMDTPLKVMLAGSVRGLSKIEVLSYDAALSCIMHNPVLVCMEGSAITRSDKFIKTDTNWFKWQPRDGNPLNSVGVQDVKSWFVRLVQDREILEDIELGMNFFIKLVAYMGKTVDLFEASVSKNEYQQRDLVDLSVLHYPDVEHPYLMLYRIVVTAWRDGSHEMFTQEDTNGLTGEFYCTKFKPRDRIINELDASVVTKAIAHARALVDN